MPCAIQSMKLIASAVEAGRNAALQGRLNNPFDGKHEVLRQAFHLGLNVGGGTVKLQSEVELLSTCDNATLAITL